MNFWDDLQDLSRTIWEEKYRHGNEKSPLESHRRIVDGIYGPEISEDKHNALTLMEMGVWCPAGRIHAGAGTDKRVTLINCFVSPTIEDSMMTEIDKNSKGIMDALAVAARTQQMGGGIGMNFDLRPKGAIVRRAGSVSAGNLPFMDMWHSMCSTVMSSGSRRGAMMATMRVDHPDILDFVTAKRQKGRLTNFNVSVLITDKFMQAVESDQIIPLWHDVPAADGSSRETSSGKHVYKEVSARQLWREITLNTYEYSEPGVIFIDRVNDMNNLSYCEKIVATNPCGEQPLPPNSDCNLGAINLACVVRNPFNMGGPAHVDFTLLSRAITTGVDFLDRVLDVSLFPTDEQRSEALSKRRIGLGITGLANMFQMMGVRYGSKESVRLTRTVMQFIARIAYDYSVDLAEVRSSFPKFDNVHFNYSFVSSITPNNSDLTERVRKFGLRNGVLLTIAPTGTTSLYYNNVSSGCEPVFSNVIRRRRLRPDGSTEESLVEDYGYRLYKKLHFGAEPPKHLFPQAVELSVDEHLSIQAACQKYVDASISKTINCPESITFEDFSDVYRKAYDMGCKGVTTYRPSEVRGAVLVAVETQSGGDSLTEGNNPSPSPVVISEEKKTDSVAVMKERPLMLGGVTYKRKWPGSTSALYITINDIVENGRCLPFEIFVVTKDARMTEWVSGLTRMISAIFRRGGDISFVYEELKEVHSSHSGYIIDREYTPSIVALLGRTIEEHFRSIGGGESVKQERTTDMFVDLPAPETGTQCPQCFALSYVKQEGCGKCLTCGFSDCG